MLKWISFRITLHEFLHELFGFFLGEWIMRPGRRSLLALLAAFGLLRVAGASARRTLTPSQTEGPFYPVEPIPLRADLTVGASGRAKGEILTVSGRVLDVEGKGLSNVLIEIWQCDAQGRYRHPRAGGGEVDPNFLGFGAVRSNASGAYTYTTIVPVPYAGRPPHIHAKLFSDRRVMLTTQIYLKGQEVERNAFIRSGNRDALVISPQPAVTGFGMSASFDFIVA